MTVSVATTVSEEVSLQQSQELIMSIFSCVGYLRDLFPEESFQDHKVAGMSLKKFRRGKDHRTDQLLDWIERGCFDALSKKYLKQAILTVLSDTSGPNNVLETYTLRVTYPASNLHQGIDASLSKLSLSRNDQPILTATNPTASFSDSMSKILRSLCVMSQTLQVLPQRKYLSMKLVYYEEVTPAGYEPPGFQAAEFELEHLFVAPSVKYSFGRAINSNHGIALSMESALAEPVPGRLEDANTIQCHGDNLAESLIVQEKVPEENPVKPRSEEVKPVKPKEDAKQVKPSKSNKISPTTTASFKHNAQSSNDVAMASQVPLPAQSPPAFPLSQVDDPLPPITPIPSSIRMVKCSCGVHKQALEMLECNFCGNWQHTVCVGFISCKDRRLEARAHNEHYFCYHCRFGKQLHTFEFLKKLSRFRKAIMMLQAEGYDTLARFTDLMEVNKHAATDIRNDLVKEGLLIDCGRWRYRVRPSDDLFRQRIKYFFHQNLTIFPEFVEAQRKDGIEVKLLRDQDGNDERIESALDKIENAIEKAKSVAKASTERSNRSTNPSPSLNQSTNPSTNSNHSTQTPQPKMTKKRQNSAANASSFNEDFMSQAPIINPGVASSSSAAASITPPASTKKLKMSVPTENISYN